MTRDRKAKQKASKVLGRYRKLFSRVWRHPDFRRLPRPSRELALYLLTGPQTNPIGCFFFSMAQASEDLAVTDDELDQALVDVTTSFGWFHDRDAKVFYIPSWWRWNQPENKNVLIGVLAALSEVPPCALVEAFGANLAHLDDQLHSVFVDACTQRIGQRYGQRYGQRAGTQEQDQRSGSENKEQEPSRRRSLVPHRRPAAQNGSDGGLTQIAREVVDRYMRPGAEIEELVDVFHQLAPDNHAKKSIVISALESALAERRAS